MANRNYRTLFEQLILIYANVISKEMEIQIPDMEFIHDLSEEANWQNWRTVVSRRLCQKVGCENIPLLQENIICKEDRVEVLDGVKCKQDYGHDYSRG